MEFRPRYNQRRLDWSKAKRGTTESRETNRGEANRRRTKCRCSGRKGYDHGLRETGNHERRIDSWSDYWLVERWSDPNPETSVLSQGRRYGKRNCCKRENKFS
jgi:hypothetical protein